MVSKETLIQRARISAAVSSFLRNPGNVHVNLDGGDRNESGEIAVVPSAPHESIAVAFHRMQRTGQKLVVLATYFDGLGRLLEFVCDEEAEKAPRTINLPGRVTVEEWFRRYGDKDEPGDVSFTCDGSEYAMEINGIGATLMSPAS